MENTQQQQQQQQNPGAVATVDKGTVTYLAAGQEVKLSYGIVRNFLTKGNSNVTDQDLVQFISICKYNQLNPFLGEAFLIKYGEQPAQMVVTKEALMKRAEANEHYQGITAGIIVKTADGAIDYREGTFYLEDEKLVGGWAEVSRDDRKTPYITRVNLREYSTGKSLWVAKPATMIRKVAIVQAMREAFPSQLGAMYTSEENGAVTEDAKFVEIKEEADGEANQMANRTKIGFGTSLKATPAPAEQPQPMPQPQPQPAPQPSAKQRTMDF